MLAFISTMLYSDEFTSDGFSPDGAVYASTEMNFDGSSLFALAVPVIVFIAVYLAIYRYYRNTDKRYKFENETEVVVSRMEKVDHRTRRAHGLTNRYIRGNNVKDHLKRI